MAKSKHTRTKEELAAIHAAGANEPTGRRRKSRVSLMRARRQAQEPETTDAPELPEVAEQAVEQQIEAEAAEAEAGEASEGASEPDTEDSDMGEFIPDEPEEPEMSQEELAAEGERVEQAQRIAAQFMPRPGSGELLATPPEEVQRIDERLKVKILGSRVRDTKDWAYNLDEGGIMTAQYDQVVGLFDPQAPPLTEEQVKALDATGLHLHQVPKNPKKGLAAPVVMDLASYVKALDPYGKAHYLPLGDSLFDAKHLRKVAGALKGPVEVRTGKDHPALITKGSRGVIIAPTLARDGEERVEPMRAFVRDMAGKAGPFHALNSAGVQDHLEEGQKILRERKEREAERQRERAEFLKQQKAAEKKRQKAARQRVSAEKKAEAARAKREAKLAQQAAREEAEAEEADSEA